MFLEIYLKCWTVMQLTGMLGVMPKNAFLHEIIIISSFVRLSINMGSNALFSVLLYVLYSVV